MLENDKVTKNLPWAQLTNKTLSKWDGRGMKLNGVVDIEIKIWIHVVAHKIYSSIHPNNVPCEVVDLAYKVVKNKISFDLAKLQLIQIIKNFEGIWASKPNPLKYGSILVCLFFYIQNLFPSKGTMVCKKDRLVVYQINEYIEELGDNFESIMDAYF